MSESDFGYLADAYNRKRDLEEDLLFSERDELPSPDNQVRPDWWALPPEPEPEGELLFSPNDAAFKNGVCDFKMPPIPDGIDDDWSAWDAWWNDDSLLFVDWPDSEPEFDYSYRRPGWPRLS
jgi:hypothetical protein